ncbi:MAG: FtsX-like permease family protein [Bacteroidota bacterium]
MFKHNILISIRSFKRFKSTFIINLVGLASGLACTLLIYFWVADEMSMDKFHANSDRIYQVLRNVPQENGDIETRSSMPGSLAKELMARFPEVESAAMVWAPEVMGGQEGFVSFDENHFRTRTYFVDPTFMQILSIPMVEGNANSVLKEKSEILISESMAIKMFGTIDNVVTKSIKLNKGRATGDYLISGVFEDLPENSTIQFDVLLNAQIMMDAYSYMKNWNNTNPDALVLLKPTASPEAFNEKIKNLIQTKFEQSESALFVQKLSDRYLKGSYENGKVSGGRIAYVRLFLALALITLAIACINFMNLSTAKAAGRLREIGVKKALGTSRRALMGQYFTESLLITTVGSILAIGIVLLVIPQFNAITGKNLSVAFSTELLIAIVTIILITGLLAGSYPAIYLSRLKATESLKGRLAKNLGDLWIRKGLVVFQFSISIILIVGVLIISRQIGYIQSKDLGYNRDNVVKFSNDGIEESAYEGFLASLENIPGVMSTSSTYHNLAGDNGKTQYISWAGKEPNQQIEFINLEMSPGYLETMGMKLVKGRTFDRKRTNEEDKIIFNQTAVEKMGLEDPIGKKVVLWGRDEKEIIGVVADFHAESLYESILPTFIQAYPMNDYTIVKIQPDKIPETMNQIEKSFNAFSSGLPFEFRFLDDQYMAMYESERKVSSLAKYFAVIAVIISCLGLLGLTAFTAEKRDKEIGIRKVLGSGVWRIVTMLSFDFIKMVLIALLIGLPISYLLASNWLSGFEFRIGLEPWYFLLSAIIILGISWLTIGFQTLKAANANPVDSLRNE